MTVPQSLDWIGSPEEWGEWGSRATAWFNELARKVLTAQTAVDVLEERDYVTASGATLTTTETTEVSLTLTPGTHVIIAKCHIEYSIAAVAYAGLLLRTSGGTLLDANYCTMYPAGSLVPLMCLVEYTASTTTTVNVRRIKTGGGTALLRNLKASSRRVA